MKLQIGQQAIDFELSDESGKLQRLSQFKEKKIVLFFYPKDNTPGCTREAYSFRDVYSEILSRDAVVIDVSKDSTQSHASFKRKYQLPFSLLSDPKAELIKTYGAWGEKKLFNRSYFLTIRQILIIDKKFRIARIFEKVNPAEYAAEVLQALDNNSQT